MSASRRRPVAASPAVNRHCLRRWCGLLWLLWGGLVLPVLALADVEVVPARPGSGFNFPYLLRSAPDPASASTVLWVETNNTGTPSDDYDVHLRAAFDVANKGFGSGVLHPERVLAVAVGGINALAILPTPGPGTAQLPYPLGVSDLRSLTGKRAMLP